MKKDSELDKSPQREKLNQVINERAIKTVYQPIVSLHDGSIYAYEALSRITLRDCNFDIGEAFVLAEKHGMLWSLEKLCKEQCLKESIGKPANTKLFLNVDPNIIHDPDFQSGLTKNSLEKCNLRADDIVFEATERTAIENMDTFKTSLNHYKAQGFSVAVDDVGSGYSGLNRIFSVTPQFIKIDMEIVRDIHKNEYKRSLLKGIANFANEMGVYIIAEGVENSLELETLIQLRIHYAQGFYLCKPNDKFLELEEEKIEEIKNLKRKSLITSSSESFCDTIGLICKRNNPVLSDEKLVNVFNLMNNNENITELVVIDKEDNFLGIIKKQFIQEYFKNKSNFNSDKSLDSFLKRDCLKVEPNVCIKNVSRMAMTRDTDEIYDSIIIIDKNKYVGVATVKDLLLSILDN